MRKLYLIWIILLSTPAFAADLQYYFGKDVAFNPNIPTPSQVLGYEPGDWHIRHDQLVTYMQKLAEASDRVTLEVIGHTHEQRPLLHLTITTPENHGRLEEIRTNHLALSRGEGEPEGQPVVVWMGYSVHGNEASGSNAAPLVAYYLAAAEGIDELLTNTVVIFDPSLNPDGLARFASWVNSHKGRNPVADNQTREHQEAWPNGRTNHYWFDLNRDWLLLVHPESRARIAQFHRWRPNVLTDHHEMGTDSTFFFQPGIPTRRNPLTPEENVTLTKKLATYHAAALDAQGELYFSEQIFDDFYYGKGSTYPDVHGCVGILFEQASSRGHVQENSYGKLTFAATIKNQLTTSLSTLQGSYETRADLLSWQRDYALKVSREAEKADIAAYVFGDPEDPTRATLMAQVLRQHHIEVNRLGRPINIDGQALEEGYVVPTNQHQYRLIRSLFEKRTQFTDNTFYDVSTWHFPSAFGVLTTSLEKVPGSVLGDAVEQASLSSHELPAAAGETYAYAFSWKHYYAPRAAYRLLDAGIKLRYSQKPFSAKTTSGEHYFDRGAIVLPMGIQDVDQEAISALLQEISQDDAVKVHAITTGLTPVGVDLGSGSLASLKKPEVAMLIGSGVSASSVSTLWHLLDVRMDMPVTHLTTQNMNRHSLERYTHLVIPEGRYSSLGEDEVAKIKTWTEDGGVLILIGRATQWAIGQKLTTVAIRKPKEEDKPQERLPYAERSQRRAVNIISGSAFAADLDLTHPLGFGYSRRDLAMFRTSTMFLEVPKNPYNTVVQYVDKPLISGYVSAKNLELLGGSAAVVNHGLKRGQVIVLADPPNFRGYWLGTNKLFLNSLFFKPASRR